MGLSRLIQSLKVRSPTVKDVPIQVSIREVEKPSPTSSSSSSSAPSLSTQQRALILFGPRQPYEEISDHPTPSVLNDRELLVRNRVIGLNPIDWKAPDFNFGIPELPYVSGRELVGEVVIPSRNKSRFQPGDLVIVISTDYRDLRKAAYQECVIATDFNVCRLPPNVPAESGSALGVAFVAAALCLGICVGLDFSKVADGPDLLSILKRLDPQRLPEDVRSECLNGINRSAEQQARDGEWLAIWGGSSTSALMMNQIAKLLGLRTISVLDYRKHALNNMSLDQKSIRPDIIVDNHDPQRAIEIVKSVTGDSLRFAVDTVGRETATHLMQCLRQEQPPDPKEHSPSSSSVDPTTASSPPLPPTHLVGLTGLPKLQPSSSSNPNITFHTVPIKLFHEVPEIGEALMLWLERLLSQSLLVPPRILGVKEGFGAVNGALDEMRRGDISGGRVVVRVV